MVYENTEWVHYLWNIQCVLCHSHIEHWTYYIYSYTLYNMQYTYLILYNMYIIICTNICVTVLLNKLSIIYRYTLAYIFHAYWHTRNSLHLFSRSSKLPPMTSSSFSLHTNKTRPEVGRDPHSSLNSQHQPCWSSTVVHNLWYQNDVRSTWALKYLYMLIFIYFFNTC